MTFLTLPVSDENRRLRTPGLAILVRDATDWGCTVDCYGAAGTWMATCPDEPRLVWPTLDTKMQWTEPVKDKLPEFLRLERASDLQILDFAVRWGPLATRAMGRKCDLQVQATDLESPPVIKCSRPPGFDPASTGDAIVWERSGLTKSDSEGAMPPPKWVWEFVGDWRDESRYFASILRTFSATAEGRLAAPDDIDAIMKALSFLIYKAGLDTDEWLSNAALASMLGLPAGWTLADLTQDEPQKQRALAGVAAKMLVGQADLRPNFVWFEDGAPSTGYFRIDVPISGGIPYHGNLRSALIVQLCEALASPLGVYICDACGRPYSPTKRRARSDRRRYCPECNAGGSLAAKRDFYHRQKEKKMRPSAASTAPATS